MQLFPLINLYFFCGFLLQSPARSLYNPAYICYNVYMHKLTFPIFCKLYNVRDKERQVALSQSREGDHLQVVLTKQGAFVYSIPLNCVLGNLRDELFQKLQITRKDAPCLDAVIEARTGGTDGKYFGCNIRIYPTANMLRGVKGFSHLYGE